MKTCSVKTCYKTAIKECVFLLFLLCVAEHSIAGSPKSFAYVLQPEQLASSREKVIKKLSECGREWIVLDAFFDSNSDKWQKEEIEKIRTGGVNRKVLAYLSIGEAENYRSYWQKEWDKDNNGIPDSMAPAWLCAENPDWEGNYKVKYWHSEWQDIVIKMVDDILAVGFDGVYLDIVDAFEFFEYDENSGDWIDYRINNETGKTYRDDMIQWIKKIANYARSANPDFIVIPQNGAQLLEDENYCKLIDAIGIEDLFTEGNKPQDRFHTVYVNSFLEYLNNYNKPVLLIEYGTKAKAVKLSINGAAKRGYVLLITDRELKTLGYCPLATPAQKRRNKFPVYLLLSICFGTAGLLITFIEVFANAICLFFYQFKDKLSINFKGEDAFDKIYTGRESYNAGNCG